MLDLDYLKSKAVEIRIELLKMIYGAGGGHTGGSLSSADILVTLFYKILRLDPNNPKWEDRDRFVLSKGHSVEGYYAILSDMGFFAKEELLSYSKHYGLTGEGIANAAMEMLMK